MRKDIILQDGDIKVADGDIVTGASLSQDIDLLLISERGQWKQNPTRGVGLNTWLESGDRDGMARAIQTELSRDSLRVKKINIDFPSIDIECDELTN